MRQNPGPLADAWPPRCDHESEGTSRRCCAPRTGARAPRRATRDHPDGWSCRARWGRPRSRRGDEAIRAFGRLTQRQQVECDDHERVGDPAVAYEAGDAGERGGFDLDLLIPVTARGLDPFEPFGEERRALVRHERRIRMDGAQRGPARAAVAGLLEHLPLRGLERRLARIDHTAGDLQRRRGDAEAPLANQDHLAVIAQRDHVHPVAGMDGDDLPAVLTGGDLLALHLEQRVLERHLASDPPPRPHG